MLASGHLVPSDEQKHSGSWQVLRSHGGALFGSSVTEQMFSSLPSLQSRLRSQKRFLEMHSPLAHCSWPSGQTGSEVSKLGLTRLGRERTSQLSTFASQSHVWRSMSKKRPPGHLRGPSLKLPVPGSLSQVATSLQSPPASSRKNSPWFRCRQRASSSASSSSCSFVLRLNFAWLGRSISSSRRMSRAIHRRRCIPIILAART